MRYEKKFWVKFAATKLCKLCRPDANVLLFAKERERKGGKYRAICFFKKKTEDRDLQYSEKENVIPDKQTEFPFSDSTASVEGGE